ncbi:MULTISPECIES: RidA family protein [Cupriavidus]|uniref:Endoribonuclease L-PSP n=1 Tax=Cupriavidus pinatubonensis (strain JMP 134 / LMG 1197) TaxID=264198 RepID=Q46N25_CUPPJ|nr:MULTISPECIES: RidA family protein [Cupriavidus]
MFSRKPYSDWVEHAGLIFFSGKTGANADGSIPANFPAQASNAMSNVSTALSNAGCEWRDVIKVTVFLTDMRDYDSFNTTYTEHLDGVFPARSCVAVVGLPRGAAVEIEVVARRTAAR